jgi:hypothetical protein
MFKHQQVRPISIPNSWVDEERSGVVLQLQVVVARVSREEVPVALTAEEQEAADLPVAVMVLRGVAVEAVEVSTTALPFGATKEVMEFAVPCLLAT